jgi:subtilisin family serine protease
MMQVNRRGKALGLLALAASMCAPGGAQGIMTSNAGIEVGQLLNLYPLYNAGYTGSRSAVAVIDAGYCDVTHPALSTLGSSIALFSGTTLSTSPSSQWVDLHATETCFTAAGRGNDSSSRGIAYGARLFSGALATSWGSNTGSYNELFNTTYSAIGQALYQAGVSGVSNTTAGTQQLGTADVISLSWSFGPSTANGNEGAAGLLDGVANSGGKLICVAAGNDGPTSNTVGSPASGFNGLVVGSLGGEASAEPFNGVSSFSSRGLCDVFVPNSSGNVGSATSGTTFQSVRARVDIAAPGEGLTLANYSGKTGGAAGATYTPPGGTYLNNQAGTSFATPIVAGIATLLTDAVKDKLGTTSKGLDGRVLKAVLMNSADKTSGWSNAASMINGVLRTTQGLDVNVGAGRVNGGAAYNEILGGTTDITGTGGGSVAGTGWDYGSLATTTGSSNDYSTSGSIAAGSSLTATLCWYAADNMSPLSSRSFASYQSFYNLTLQVYLVSSVDLSLTLVAESASQYNSSEHIYFPSLPQSGQYVLRVVNSGANWSFSNPGSVPYGLAWEFKAPFFSSLVPEPGNAGVMGTVVMMLGRRRRV